MPTPQPVLKTRLIRAAVMGLLAKVPQGLVLFAMGEYGIFLALGLRLNFPLNALYSTKHLALGAAFGLLFAVPVWSRRSNTLRGLLVGLGHAAATLFIFNPFLDGVGLLGLDIGPLMPPLVIVSNLIWGVLAGIGIDLWNRVAAEAEPEGA